METGKDKEERVSKGARIAMIAIVVGLVVVRPTPTGKMRIAIRLRVTVTRIAPEASASPTP